MNIILKPTGANILKRSCEAIFEGSEIAQIKITSSIFQLKSLDVLGNCQCTFQCLPSFFVLYKVNKSILYSILLKELFLFLKEQTSPINLSFTLTNHNKIKITNTCNNSSIILKELSSDSTIYIDIKKKKYCSWTTISLDPLLFHEITLNLSVGGGITKISIEDQKLKLLAKDDYTRVEICSGELVFKTNENYCLQFYTKFFKQTCNIVQYTQYLNIYIKKSSPIVLYLQLNNESTFVMVIAPVNLVP